MISQDSGETQIAKLTGEIRRICTEKGWRDGIIGAREGYEFPAYLALVHSELSEALEAYRDKMWSSSERIPIPGYITFQEKPVGIGPELADAIIRILDICDIWDINIEYELRRVLDYGRKRPYQHGGRVL